MSIMDQVSHSKQTRHEPKIGFRNVPPSATSEPVISILEKPELQAPSLFPQRFLQLGKAEDGKPVLLDLFDPAQGPVLVAGDEDGGKTAFLQSLTLGSDLENPGDILFGVLTPFPEEWSALEGLSNCLGIWPAYHLSARHFLSQLVSWAAVLPDTRQVVILMVDGLDLLLANGFQDQNDLRWLLTYGPRLQVWPVVSVNPGRLPQPASWLGYFQARIIGSVKRPQTAQLLVAPSRIDLGDISQKGQYGYWRPDGWLKFKLPSDSLDVLSLVKPWRI
jgi:hypothetical protein